MIRGPFYTAFSMSLMAVIMMGCAIEPKFARPQVVAEPNSVDVMIADAADRATRALETLADIENTKTPVKSVAVVPNAPLELQRAVTFEWTGPVEPLVMELAQKAGYNYNTVGDAPTLPVIVNVRATNQPLIDVLRNIGLQMGARADLKVNGQARVMEVHYAATVNRAAP
jgi:defect-in-organelle-trafficking protein DotD